MKHKLLLIIAVLLSAVAAKAQTYDSLVFYAGTYHVSYIRNSMLVMRDGGILANMQLFTLETVMDTGCLFVKSMRDSTGLFFVDSLFIEDRDMNYFLLERNPFDDDNVYAKIERNFDSCRSDLRIRFFDDNLNFKPEKEVVVTVADTLMPPLADGYMLDPDGDIIAYFPIRSRNEIHFIRAGLDGTVKDNVVVPASEIPIKIDPQLGIFNKSPREYYVYGGINYYGDGLSIVILDSLFNPVRTLNPCGLPPNYAFEHGTATDKLMVWDDSTFWFSGSYYYTNVIDTIDGSPAVDPTGNKNGALLGKFRKSDGSAISLRIIREEQFPYSTSIYPIDIIKTDDGCAYFSYCGSLNHNANSEALTTMKLDKDLGLLWEAHSFKAGVCVGGGMRPLENGGVAIVGDEVYANINPYEMYMFFLVVDDNSFSIPEHEAEACLFAVYPNPATDVINLSLLTDAEPSLIELYDIQGRMVRSQENNFERISLRGLPVGTYALRVSMKDGKMYTSTVVKR